jgi:hypothetical protein
VDSQANFEERNADWAMPSVRRDKRRHSGAPAHLDPSQVSHMTRTGREATNTRNVKSMTMRRNNPLDIERFE